MKERSYRILMKRLPVASLYDFVTNEMVEQREACAECQKPFVIRFPNNPSQDSPRHYAFDHVCDECLSGRKPRHNDYVHLELARYKRLKNQV